MKQYPKIGIRPIIDGRLGVREGLEDKTMAMALGAKELIESELTYADGTPVECVIADTTIGGGAEAAACAEKFGKENVCATLSVTPCWCYGSETMDMDPLTIKAIWGFNGTERPGAVYLAATLAAHTQKGLPAFSIYGRDVQDVTDNTIPDDVKEKILRFARCAVAVGQMRNRAYVGIGGVSMGIIGSCADPDFFQKYFNIRTEWVDMSEVSRRVKFGIYDQEEYERALAWVKKNCPEGYDKNPEEKKHTREQKDAEWEFVVKMALIFRDIMLGNPKLADRFYEESLGKNGILGGFQGQRQWSDWMPVGDFAETILNTTFDWNGKRPPVVFATENDSCNGVSMLLANLLTGQASIFADVRTYWSPEALERVTGKRPTGYGKNGFIHLINSGSAALDATGMSRDENGKPLMKQWWKMTEEDIEACLKVTDWCPADSGYFRGGGYSCHFKTRAEMPVTMLRVNLVEHIGPVLQLAEGYTVVLEDEIHDILDQRTDPTWPTTWFAPRLTGKGAFRSVYDVMNNWGANHSAFTYGHIGKDLITLASMLRIPVAMHNVDDSEVFRPHAWGAFGTKDLESADFRACEKYGPLYR